jgi:tetratricopeptide (TPR) repeat protein
MAVARCICIAAYLLLLCALFQCVGAVTATPVAVAIASASIESSDAVENKGVRHLEAAKVASVAAAAATSSTSAAEKSARRAVHLLRKAARLRAAAATATATVTVTATAAADNAGGAKIKVNSEVTNKESKESASWLLAMSEASLILRRPRRALFYADACVHAHAQKKEIATGSHGCIGVHALRGAALVAIVADSGRVGDGVDAELRKEAIGAYRRAIEAAPTELRHDVALGDLLLTHGKVDDALAAFTAAQRGDDDRTWRGGVHRNAQYGIGRVWLAVARKALVRKALADEAEASGGATSTDGSEAARGINGNNETATTALQMARTHLKSALSMYSDDSLAHKHALWMKASVDVADVVTLQGEIDLAVSVLKGACNDGTDASHALLPLFALANAQRTRGKWKRARKVFKECRQLIKKMKRAKADDVTLVLPNRFATIDAFESQLDDDIDDANEHLVKVPDASTSGENKAVDGVDDAKAKEADEQPSYGAAKKATSKKEQFATPNRKRKKAR